MKIDFAKYSSVRIGGTYEVAVLDERAEFNAFIIGGANNLLVSPAPKTLGILGKNFDFIEILEQNAEFCVLEIGCATRASKIHSFCKERNLGGLEFLRKIPGLLGGLLKMNAGLKDECISANLLSVNLAKNELLREEIAFSYRFCPINETMFSAKFRLKFGFDAQKDELLKSARSNQPSGASFGSIFKNPKGDFAGRLVEAVGLKGLKKGGAMISDKHANFLINVKNASFEDAIYLIELAEKRVFDEFGLHLEREVVVI